MQSGYSWPPNRPTTGALASLNHGNEAIPAVVGQPPTTTGSPCGRIGDQKSVSWYPRLVPPGDMYGGLPTLTAQSSLTSGYASIEKSRAQGG